LSIVELAEYLYLTRLFYSKCQGVFLITEYGLNKCIAEAWINVILKFRKKKMIFVELF
jgi:hypothetical protein